MKRIITKEEYEQVIELYTSGMLQAEISSITGISRESVRSELRRKGLICCNLTDNNERVVEKKFTQLDEDQIIAQCREQSKDIYELVVNLYTSGITVAKVSLVCNLSMTTVERYLRQFKVTKRDSSKPKGDEFYDRLVECYKNGMSNSELRQTFGLTQASLSRILLSFGYDIDKKPIKLSDKQKKAVAMYLDGIKIMDICKELKMDKITVLKYVRKLGYPTRGSESGRIKSIDKEKVDTIIRLHKDGLSDEEISKKVGTSVATVHANVRELKAKNGYNHRLDDSVKEEIKQLVYNGLSTPKISRKLDIKESTIYYLKAKHGWTRAQ